jgi:hypothetical protein
LKDKIVLELRMKNVESTPSKSKRNYMFILTVLVIAIAIGYIRMQSEKEEMSKHSAHNWLLVDQVFDDDTLEKLKEITQTSLFETKTIDPHIVESAGEAVPAGHPDCEQ